MKTRAEIYGNEAADLLRTVTMYPGLSEQQLLCFHPGKEDTAKALLSHLERQGRIFQAESGGYFPAGQPAKLDRALVRAVWVLLDFIQRAEYHAPADFPTQVRSSRFAGVLLAPTGIFVTYNSGAALMKWRCKSEIRVKALMWSVLCQQRLAGQYRAEDVHGLVLGDSMELAYQMLTSTGGAKHDYFMLDGSYDHFYFLTNNHQGEVILALLCDPLKTAELNRILSQGLIAGNTGKAIEQDAAEQDGTPVLFGYSCDLPRITRFSTSLDLMERPGTLICFDFQADVLRRYCGSRVRFQTIDFTKFEGRLFP